MVTNELRSTARGLIGCLALGLPCAVSAAAQSWTLQAPLPTGSDLHDVQLLSESEAWAIGGAGLLLHTADGGNNWQAQQLQSDSTWALYFLDTQHGWAAGNGLFHTLDGGQSWIKDSAWGSIYALHFIDAQRGWACGNGGVTYRTTNGGLSWSFQAVGSPATLRSVFFVDALTGWTVNIDGEIFKSTDGGASWSLNWNQGTNLNTVQFFDASEGWVIGGNTFLHTTNGGLSWQKAPVPIGTWVHGARFSDRLHGWGVGEGGHVRTTNGGQSWSAMTDVQPGPRLWNVDFADAQTGMYVGETGVLDLSRDGGITWSSLQSGGSGSTHAFDAVDALHAWAANDGGEVLVTANGGEHWQRVLVSGFDKYGRILDIDFVDPQNGWAVGDSPSFATDLGRVVRSTNGGTSWQVVHDIPGGFMSAVEGIDPLTAFAFGWVPFCCDFLMRTKDGGVTWQNVAPGGLIEAIQFVDSSTGWLAGGRIWKTTNGGDTWVPQHTPLYTLEDISFADAQHGWAAGWFGTLVHTTDGGTTWTPQDAGTGTAVNFLGVSAVSPTTAWLVGTSGFVARTTDGGQTWIREVPAAAFGSSYECALFLDEGSGWISGAAGVPGGGIWHRSEGSCTAGATTYCTAKVNSQGCAPAIDSIGVPSHGAGTGFMINASLVVPGTNGLFFYSTTAATSTPFQGGFLCAAPPLRRTPLQNAGGATPCSGHFALDFNAWIASGTDPALSVGAQVWGQYWSRDPASSFSTSLSNALTFVICP